MLYLPGIYFMIICEFIIHTSPHSCRSNFIVTEFECIRIAYVFVHFIHSWILCVLLFLCFIIGIHTVSTNTHTHTLAQQNCWDDCIHLFIDCLAATRPATDLYLKTRQFYPFVNILLFKFGLRFGNLLCPTFNRWRWCRFPFMWMCVFDCRLHVASGMRNVSRLQLMFAFGKQS